MGAAMAGGELLHRRPKYYDIWLTGFETICLKKYRQEISSKSIDKNIK
jgi:hypothetical protein